MKVVPTIGQIKGRPSDFYYIQTKRGDLRFTRLKSRLIGVEDFSDGD